MSALGQKQTFAVQHVMSALPPKADIRYRDWDVRLVPIADIRHYGSLVWSRRCCTLGDSNFSSNVGWSK